jgi:RHS repeat-associated protein
LDRYYYIKDHLGSIRVTTDETGTVVSAQDYFAYGELLREHNSIERYKYTEKERDAETGYDYFGARYYDSEIGRWLAVDPLSDSYPSWSPYSYTGNNPINSIDINGMEWIYISGYGWVWQLEEEVVVTAKRYDNFTYGADNSFAATLVLTGTSAITISASTILVPLIGLMALIPGDTEVWKQDEKRWLMSEDAKGQSASEKLPNLTGKSREEADKELEDAGFSPKGETKGGYKEYRHPDGSRIWIRPNGDIVRLNPKVQPEGGGKGYRPRIGPDGTRIGTHNTGEKLK